GRAAAARALHRARRAGAARVARRDAGACAAEPRGAASGATAGRGCRIAHALPRQLLARPAAAPPQQSPLSLDVQTSANERPCVQQKERPCPLLRNALRDRPLNGKPRRPNGKPRRLNGKPPRARGRSPSPPLGGEPARRRGRATSGTGGRSIASKRRLTS